MLATTLSPAAALMAVENERLLELFSEWGHRWFDLIRTGRVAAVVTLLCDSNKKCLSTDLLPEKPARRLPRPGVELVDYHPISRLVAPSVHAAE